MVIVSCALAALAIPSRPARMSILEDMRGSL
jgi:hypothetical protein